MYSLRLTCRAEEAETLSAELWALGTVGIHELDDGDRVRLIAGFADAGIQDSLRRHFAAYSPEYEIEECTDWTERVHEQWPARLIGNRIYLAPYWSSEVTPSGRVRIVHNPGMASGTGEHPCTQLALAALESHLSPGSVVADIGTGSGILAIAALRLGAGSVVGVDNDSEALNVARENFGLNDLDGVLVAGSADCIRDGCVDYVVANVDGSVLLSILDDLLRIVRPDGRVTLTGFADGELSFFLALFARADVTAIEEWRCISFRVGR